VTHRGSPDSSTRRYRADPNKSACAASMVVSVSKTSQCLIGTICDRPPGLARCGVVQALTAAAMCSCGTGSRR